MMNQYQHVKYVGVDRFSRKGNESKTQGPLLHVTIITSFICIQFNLPRCSSCINCSQILIEEKTLPWSFDHPSIQSVPINNQVMS